MDSKKHSAATGSAARISPKEGGKYSAHSNYIKGKSLHLIKNKLIVQTWRGAGCDKNHVDSTFIFCLEQKGNEVVLYETHANVPDSEYDGINKGWSITLLEAMEKYLAENPISGSIKM